MRIPEVTTQVEGEPVTQSVTQTVTSTPEELLGQGKRFAYLGRSYQANSGREEYQNFDLDRLTRHGVILGSTGSGKTGVGINLIESCLLNQIPVIAVDPKGDLGNLLYMPTDFTGEEYRDFCYPLDENGERPGGRVPKEGDREWVQSELEANEIKVNWEEWDIPLWWGYNLLGRTDIRLYTPGSQTGLPIGVRFHENGGKDEGETLEECSQSASALLSLVGYSVAPQEPISVMLSWVIYKLLKGGKPTRLMDIIEYLENEEIPKATGKGERNKTSLEEEDYVTVVEGQKLLNRLKALLKSVDYQKWLHTPAPRVKRLLWNSKGTPLCSILNIAHLHPRDQEYYLSNLLQQLIQWMREMGGTQELKCLLYLDECNTWIPAVKNPVTKSLLMTLLKQGRAYGVGVVLATQNPGDIDYKALGNIGTWIVGLLKTERDREKVAQAMNNPESCEIISGLGRRQFLYSDTFSGEENTFGSRQTCCIMTGPLPQEEIQRLVYWRHLQGAIELYQKILGQEDILNMCYCYQAHPSKNELLKEAQKNHLLWQLVDRKG